jgi:thiamine phosphate synthase YjbQ (UPF0047 family)
MACIVLPHVTASVFINDDESGLYQDYEKWLEGRAPHAPINQCRHNRTGEDNADAHLKQQVMECEVAMTNGRLDFGPEERSFSGQTEWLTRQSRRSPAEAGIGQDRR